MQFIVDNSVSWRLAEKLRQAGHDAIHVREIGMADAPDPAIYKRSVADTRIIITQDVDFGYLLATSDTDRGTVILLRMASGKVADQWRRISMLLDRYSSELTPAAIIVLSETAIRIRRF